MVLKPAHKCQIIRHCHILKTLSTGKKIPSGTVVNKEIPLEEQQQGPSWQCNLAES